LRTTRGKNEARRVRVTGMIPAIVYGAFKESVAVTVNPKDVLKILRSKTGHNSIFDVNVEGVEQTPVIVADESYDPIKGNLLHVDFRRIDLTRKLKVAIPIHVFGEAKGVKQQGCNMDVITRSVEIECIPDDIPNQFEVDVTELMVGGTIRVSDLPLKPGVRIVTDGHSVIAHVIGVKEEVVAAVEEAPAKKGKKEAAKKAAAPAAKAAKTAAPPAKKK
jgi:large subunit ribosomal protein L25